MHTLRHDGEVFGRSRRPERAESSHDAVPRMVDAAYVPLWASEIVKVALEDVGIIASVVEQRFLPGQGLPMARIFVPADRLAEARTVIDEVIVS
jgi:hypothetical protein